MTGLLEVNVGGSNPIRATWRSNLGRRELVPAGLLALNTHMPNKVVGGFNTKPQLHHTADAESFILTSQEAPCALQHKPELHKACLSILNFHIKNRF